MTQFPRGSDGGMSRCNCEQGKLRVRICHRRAVGGNVTSSEGTSIRTRSKSWTGGRESASGSASPETSKGQTVVFLKGSTLLRDSIHPPTPRHCVITPVAMSRSLIHKSATHWMAHMGCPDGRWQHELNSFCTPPPTKQHLLPALFSLPNSVISPNEAISFPVPQARNISHLNIPFISSHIQILSNLLGFHPGAAVETGFFLHLPLP